MSNPDLAFGALQKPLARQDAAERKYRRRVRTCRRCGTQFMARKPSELRVYCSAACCYKHRLEARPPCPVCSKPRARTFKTCSRKCGYTYRKRRTRPLKRCRQCSETFWPTKSLIHHCSRRCYFASLAAKNARLTLSCPQCGTTFRRYATAAARVIRSFCSNRCATTFHRGARNPGYRGASLPNRGSAWKRLAAEIRQRDGYRCQLCGRTQEEEGSSLSVDHINPWRMCETTEEANQRDNLITLCRSCHAKKTMTFEAAFLRGDCLGMYRYEHMLKMPPFSFRRIEVKP